MTLRRLVKSGGLAVAALALAAATPCFAWTASLRDSLGASADDRFDAPLVGRFRPETGDAFIVDRTAGRSILVRFDDSPETWVLSPFPGPRGDVIYKNDVGDAVLRATRVGGLTVFTHDKPGGMAAAFDGEAPSLQPPAVNSPGALLRAFTQASARAGRAIQQVISFEARDVPLAAAPLFADAAQVTAEAFVLVGARRDRNHRVARWDRVEFVTGAAPEAAGEGGALTVTLVPDLGFAGRPSSERIAEAIFRAR